MLTRFVSWILVGSFFLMPGLAGAAGELSSKLRSTLEAIQRGAPDLSQMEPLTAAAVEQQMGSVRPMLEDMGKIQSLTFLGVQTMPGGSGEAYRVKFDHGSMLWVISESSGGKIQILWTQGPETASPAPGR